MGRYKIASYRHRDGRFFGIRLNNHLSAPRIGVYAHLGIQASPIAEHYFSVAQHVSGAYTIPVRPPADKTVLGGG
jgi:hypothetical protein